MTIKGKDDTMEKILKHYVPRNEIIKIPDNRSMYLVGGYGKISLEVKKASRLLFFTSLFAQQYMIKTAVHNMTYPGNMSSMSEGGLQMEKKIYTPREAWELLGIGRTRFYQLLKGGKLRYFKNGNRYLIPESAIANFIIEQMAKGGE